MIVSAEDVDAAIEQPLSRRPQMQLASVVLYSSISYMTATIHRLQMGTTNAKGICSAISGNIPFTKEIYFSRHLCDPIFVVATSHTPITMQIP
jgi:hypothetical protein